MAELPKADMAPYTLLGQTADPMKKMSETVNLLGSIQQVQKGNLEINAKRAAGTIFQKHIDEGGRVNWDAALKEMSKDKNAAYLVPEMLEHAGRIQGIDKENFAKDIANEAGMRDTLASRMLAKMERHGDGLKLGHAAEILSSMMKDFPKDFPPEKAADYLVKLSAIPEGPQLYAAFKEIYTGSQSAAQAQASMLARKQLIDRGGQIDVVEHGPGRGPTTLGQVAKTQTPSERNVTTERTDAQGRKTLQIIPSVTPTVDGMGRPQPPGAAPGFPPAAVGGPAPAAGRTPQPPTVSGVGAAQPPGGVPPSSPEAPPMATRPLPLTPSPRESAAFVDAAKYDTDLRAESEKAATGLKRVLQVKEAMKKAPTGGGSSFRSNVATIAQGLELPNSIVDQIAKGDKGAQDVLKKLLYETLTDSKAFSVDGQPSDAVWRIVANSNISLDTDPRGAKKLLELLENAYQAKVAEKAAYNRWLADNPTGVGWREKWIPFAMKHYMKMQYKDGTWTLKE